MRLTKFEAVMTMGDKDCNVKYDGILLVMDGVPPEYAQQLVAHLERFKLRAPKKPWKKKTTGGSNGVVHRLPEEPVSSTASSSSQVATIEEPVPETPAAKKAAAKVEAVVAKQAAAREPGDDADELPAQDEIAAAKQVSDLVHVLVAKRGFNDVAALVAECERLKEQGHPAVCRIANLGDRVRRRAVMEGLEV